MKVGDTIDYYNFAKRLKLARQSKGLTAEQLAEMVDLSVKTIWHLEAGERGTSLPALINFCNILEVSPEYLLGADLKSSVHSTDSLIDLFSKLSAAEINLFAEFIKTYLNNKPI